MYNEPTDSITALVFHCLFNSEKHLNCLFNSENSDFFTQNLRFRLGNSLKLVPYIKFSMNIWWSPASNIKLPSSCSVRNVITWQAVYNIFSCYFNACIVCKLNCCKIYIYTRTIARDLYKIDKWILQAPV